MFLFRTCAWGQHRNEEEKQDEEKPEDETAAEKVPEPVKEKGEDYDFIVSGAIGNGSDSPEVKVWRVEANGIKHVHSLTGHSLGIVSVDVSPNGKCKPTNKQRRFSYLKFDSCFRHRQLLFGLNIVFVEC